ncbi:hypothetical protein JHK85_004681 [Glycine max]|uniref:DDE Tnp4 domain-containing protein n=1 Tax=Glycine max TaxID=3847 RepID=A0A0R0L5H2_SOYBN|nr:hypothetical protein JHK85_004681 [Glycine max]KAG5080439.1 hypothetical protein JHK86_004504 [Glycine max]
MLKVCVEEVNAGNKPHNHFTKLGWANIAEKNRWDSLKKEWQLWAKLIGKDTGLGWDGEKKTIAASDEWWEAKLCHGSLILIFVMLWILVMVWLLIFIFSCVMNFFSFYRMSSSLSSNDSSSANVINYFMNYVVKNPCRDSSMKAHRWVSEILNGHPIRCYQMFRMKKLVFLELCDILETKYNLKKTRNVNIYEQVGLFLYMLSQPGSVRNCEERFQHSGETISKHFHSALEVVCMFAKDIIILDYIGAIDGTHIRVCVPSHLQGVYIGRKGYTTTNVMVVCDFSMCFTFVWAGWEGSAHDTKIFMEALRKPALHFPHPPEGT